MLKISKGQTPINSLEELLGERDAILDELHFQLVKAQNRMRRVANAHRRDEVFAVGNLVFLKLQPYRQKSLASRPFEKLAARYYGPFRIFQKIGEVAYKLDLPSDCKIHPVFHVSQLKRTVGATQVSTEIPPHLSAELEMVVTPEVLLEVRQLQKGNEKCGSFDQMARAS